MVDDPLAVLARQDRLSDDPLHGRGADARPSRGGDGDGEIVACGPPAELGGREELPTEIRFALPPGVGIGELPALPADAHVSEQDERVLVQSDDGVSTTHALTGWALERGFELRGFSVAQPTLEDVYLSLTGEGEEHG